VNETNREKGTRVNHPTKVETLAAYLLPEHMRAWVLGDPGQLATDLEIIRHGAPALIGGGEPFNKMFTPGHEYMGTVAALGPGVDEYRIGQRVTVEVHGGCGQCKRCREGMYTAWHPHRSTGTCVSAGMSQRL
jgi:L-iditol 2-dehydrogenase